MITLVALYDSLDRLQEHMKRQAVREMFKIIDPIHDHAAASRVTGEIVALKV